MLNVTFHATSKEAAKATLLAKTEASDDDALTPAVQAALEALIDAMPEMPEGGSILVSFRANIPLGGYGDNMLLEVAFHDTDLTAA